MNRPIAEVSTFSHSAFLAFARYFHRQAHEESEKKQLVQSMHEHIQTFTSILRELTAHEAGRAIDRLEARRYALTEKIMDRLDYNRSVKVVDFSRFLDSYNLTEQTALFRTPGYSATNTLLAGSL